MNKFPFQNMPPYICFVRALLVWLNLLNLAFTAKELIDGR